MARHKRDDLKRVAGHELHCIKQALSRCLQLADLVVEQHEEYICAFDAIVETLRLADELSRKLYTELWGYVPEEVERWRK